MRSGIADEAVRHPKERGLVGDRIEITVSASPAARSNADQEHDPECWRTSAGACSVNGCFRQLQPLRSRLRRTARDSRLASLCQLRTMGGVADVALSIVD